MTILAVITELDNLKPNAYTNAQKTGWLNKIEGRIYAEVIQTHENEITPITYTAYVDVTDEDTVLIAPSPYDELYVFYLMVQVDLYNQEYDKFNNSKDLFDAAYKAYTNFWNREYLPTQITTHFAL